MKPVTWIEHAAPVEIAALERLSDEQITAEWMDLFRLCGVSTVAQLRSVCARARADGLVVFPPCDNTDERGFCKGCLLDADQRIAEVS